MGLEVRWDVNREEGGLGGLEKRRGKRGQRRTDLRENRCVCQK